MWLAVNEVATDNADAIVSAGNTGVLMAMSKLQLKMISGVTRPAIAGFIPTLKGLCCMLDLGANIEVDERNLVQFGIMGASFCSAITGGSRLGGASSVNFPMAVTKVFLKGYPKPFVLKKCCRGNLSTTAAPSRSA